MTERINSWGNPIPSKRVEAERAQRRTADADRLTVRVRARKIVPKAPPPPAPKPQPTTLTLTGQELVLLAQTTRQPPRPAP